MKTVLLKGIIACLFIGLATLGGNIVTDSSNQALASASQNTSGTVLETMGSGGYTYMKVDTGSGQPWIAIPKSSIKVGQKVTYLPGAAMKNFSSKTLNRSFEVIIFSAGLAGADGAATKPAGMGMDGMQAPQGMTAPKGGADDSFSSAVKAEGGAPAVSQAAASGGSVGAIAPFTELSIDKAAGDNAHTVGEIFKDADTLNGKTVRIQGKVVKFSPMIMGRNWIHLQDGSGDPITNTHDLVITTSEQVKADDIITVEGVLTTNKDFGYGYKYDAIIEKAIIVK
jgi:hypothetical protein